MRIVSLLPSATEIVYALGLGEDLVGVTFECDEPASARSDKTVVVGGRDTKGLTPGEIDAYVREQMAAGADLYTLHAEALAGLDPELILTQDLCRVCALPSDHVEDALDYLGCRADVLATMQAVAVRAGVADRAAALTARLRDRLAAVERAVAGRPRPRIAVVEWVEPPFTAGHWVPDLVVAAGGEPVSATARARSVETTWAAIAADVPDIVVISPCGYHLDGAAAQAEAFAEHLPPGAAIWAIDADGIVVRPGPRLVDGVEALASIAHPDAVTAPPGSTRLIRPAQARAAVR